jgi:hypothetical protein
MQGSIGNPRNQVAILWLAISNWDAKRVETMEREAAQRLVSLPVFQGCNGENFHDIAFG